MYRMLLLFAAIFLFFGCSVSVRPSPGAASGEPMVPRLQAEAPTYALYSSEPDQTAASVTQLDFASARFTELFGAAPPKIAVVIFEHPAEMETFDLTEARGQGRLVLPWLSDEGIRAASPVVGGLAARRPLSARALSHEACHFFLIAHVSRELGFEDPHDRLRSMEASSYGDPSMPDWFDEAVATLCEPDDLVSERMEEMRNGLGDHIPLATFFSIEHPSRSARASGSGDASTPRSGLRISIRRSDPDPTTALFYPQALSLGTFLIRREGPEIMARLARGFAAGQSLAEILPDAARPEEMEREWLAWMRALSEP